MKLAILRSETATFKRWLKFLCDRGGAEAADVEAAVATIVKAVKRRGDRAVIEFTARYDRVKLSAATLRVSAAELKVARAALKPEERRALELAVRRIRDFHVRTMDRSFSYRDRLGMRLGQVVRPLERVGIYVPGGQGAYPSSVLMNAIPARVAGVREIVMVSPASPDGERGSVLAAAAIAGVDEVYRIGGAQAVAALAYGTESIRPVDKIVGPGNAYVQAAKRMVYGVVDIDKIAGPSEVVVIADDGARAQWVAADLIAQAEHGSGDEAAVLLTPSRRLAIAVAAALDQALLDLPRADAVRRALAKRGGLVVVRDLEEAFAIANRIAPEHLELEIKNPDALDRRGQIGGRGLRRFDESGAAGRLPCRAQSRAADGRRGAVCLAAGCLRFRQAKQYNPGHDRCGPPAGTYGCAAGPHGRFRSSRPRDRAQA